MLDGNYGEEQIAGLHEEAGKDFYNSIEDAREFCLANNINNKNLFFINAELPWNLGKVKFDLCYSVKSIGFHWPINVYLEKIYTYMRLSSYLLFELRDTRQDSYPTEKHWKRRVAFVDNQLKKIDQTKYTIVESNTNHACPMLILRRNP